MVHQYAINTAKVCDIKEAADFFDLISEERKQKISKFYFTKDKVHSLCAEIILRYVLCKQYDFTNAQIKFGYSDYGKPYIDGYRDIHYNISHSGSWVLCAIGDVPLGIDVELMKDKKLDITDRFFSKEENDFIMAQSKEDRISVFYKFWTLKESYVKNVGKGLSIPFDSFSFQIAKRNIQLWINGRQNNDYRFYTNQLDYQHCTALCVSGRIDIGDKNIKVFTMEELFQWVEYVMR